MPLRASRSPSPVNFLLECIGFPPEQDRMALLERVREEGEAVAWRGDPDNHRRLPLGGGLELRVDREPEQDFWTLLPYYRVPYRLRIAVERLRKVPDSPFDALLTGWACPPSSAELHASGGPLKEPEKEGAYRLSTWLSDARRLPARLPLRHVLAVSVAGFALNVEYAGPNDGVSDPAILDSPHGARILPLGGPQDPGGCSEVSLRVKSIRHLRNKLTGEPVDLVVADAPERPLLLFVSPWQLRHDGLSSPRPGWRIEGAFLFTGTIAGGLEGPKRRRSATFG